MIEECIEAATLCEGQGFPGPATALRAATGPGFRAFVVLERRLVGRHYVDEPKVFLSDDGVPHALFLRPEPASRYALEKNARALRGRNLFNYLYDTSSFTSYCTTLGVAEFEARVGEILGIPFRLGMGDRRDLRAVHDLPPMFPGHATDDQMRRIAGLFSHTFFYVEEVVFAGDDLDPVGRLDRDG